MTAATSSPPSLRLSVDRSWWSWAGPHGGHLASFALRAAAPTVPHMTPRALSAQFLSSAPEGEVEVEAELLRAGRSTAMTAVRLRGADGRLALVATVTSGTGDPAGHVHEGVPRPDVPPVSECVEAPPPVELVPFSQHL